MNQLGYFGKTRHRGDFVRFNLPQSFTKVWDDWLQQIILEGESRHQGVWKDLYDNAPTQRFVLSSGIAGSQMWIGILLPSQDKVGRRFPFCLAMSLPESNLPCVAASQMTPWFNDAQHLLTRMQASDFDFDQLQAELGTLAEKYEQSDATSSPLSTTSPEPNSDTIGVTVTSSDPLNHPIAVQALLDGVLSQTLGEYSIWMRQDGREQTLLHSGLPIAQSALAMFSGDTGSSANTHVDLALLGLNSLVTDTLATSAVAAIHHAPDNSSHELPASAIPELQGEHQDNHIELSGDTLATSNITVPHPSGKFDSINALNKAEENRDQDAPALEQKPSADDWAALDDFSPGAEEKIEITIPEVEPLELDEDESADAEDAPWET